MRAVLLFLALALSVSAAPNAAEFRARLPLISPVLNTHSMEPELYGGDSIIIYAVPFSDIGVGSRIVRVDAWRRTPVCHVVIRNEGTAAMPRWVTQGINNKEPDRGWLLEGNYVGEWKRVEKFKP